MNKKIQKKNTANPNKKNESNIYANDCDRVGEIAIHYGFSVINTPKITDDDVSKAKQFKEYDYYNDTEEKVSLTRLYMEQNMISTPQPVMIHYKKPLHNNQYKKKPNEELYGFEIMGSNKSTSEALIIKTALAILGDLGYKNLFVGINSIGDKESISKFDRDFSIHIRKNGHELSSKIKQDYKKNLLLLLKDTKPETEAFRENMPQTIASLSDLGRIYFKEVLEYMESFKSNYSISQNIISNKLYANHTVFEIYEPNKKSEMGSLLAYGYRYNSLAKKIGFKKDIPSVGLTIIVKKTSGNKKININKIKKPIFYLVQLGNTAKLKALNVVEMLRKNKIYVYHSITKDKIVGQLSGAEYMGATHLLIIGQKEAIDGTVLIRNIKTRAQDTVNMDNLAVYLKNLA